MRPKCALCPAPAKRTKKNKYGYMRLCKWCYAKPYRQHRKDYCEDCGFIPIWIGQLDVDHIDSDHNNNDPSNLRTLCANCHRLKTHCFNNLEAKPALGEEWLLFQDLG